MIFAFFWNFIIRCIESFALYPAPPFPTYYSETVRRTLLASGREVAHLIHYRGKWMNDIPPGKPIVLCYHGNGMGLRDCADLYHPLFENVDAVFVIPEYANYVRGGFSSRMRRSTQTEELLEEAVEFCNFIHTNQPSAPLFVLGHSLGTGVAIHLAATPSLSSVMCGVMLVSPYLSIVSIVSPVLAKWMPWIDLLCSHKLVSSVKCPMLSFAGMADGLIAPWHSAALFDLQHKEDNTVLLRGAGHNSIMTSSHMPLISDKMALFIRDCCSKK